MLSFLRCLHCVAEALNAPESALANFLMKDLPLSLRPPPEGGYPPVAPVEWGWSSCQWFVSTLCTSLGIEVWQVAAILAKRPPGCCSVGGCCCTKCWGRMCKVWCILLEFAEFCKSANFCLVFFLLWTTAYALFACPYVVEGLSDWANLLKISSLLTIRYMTRFQCVNFKICDFYSFLFRVKC